MCGIVGYVGKDKCIPKIINGLESLEYRGYDSAGIAYIADSKIEIIKEEGRIDNLKQEINVTINSHVGIGHTRWATHGKPSDENSHPHQVGHITLVHNGIVENYNDLKKEVGEYNYLSETDSEVVAAYIDKLYREKNNILEVLKELKSKLIGSYALGILVDNEEKIYAIRKDSPLIIGISQDGNFIASDVPAILEYTNMYYLLYNDEYAVLDKDDVVIYNENGDIVCRNILTFEASKESAMKNGYDHFMLKEIFEQPYVLKETIKDYISNINNLNEKMNGLEKYDAIDIVGCGSAYHVGLVGKSLITKYANIPVNVEIASEYRYSDYVYSKKHLIILISQSGETADTLAVLRKAKQNGIDTLSIVNVVGSSIARESDKVLYIKAGPEIAVATTKAYSCQLIMLSLIATYLGIKRKVLKEDILNIFNDIDVLINDVLKNTKEIEKIAKKIYKKKDIFFLGRKVDYSLSMEASLKLKEISYIHSEAYAAGELKHGTISLIEKNTPVISIITDDDVKFKTISNIKEVCARGALSIIITNDGEIDKDLYSNVVLIPKVHELVSPLLVIVKCQLLSYYVAKLKGCDIDKPRNLAKSVTVE
ncbi:MAG: glutamine--fructose-6-phosphate transaminase (isomerizing) [Candidatus Coprovivens sp.]